MEKKIVHTKKRNIRMKAAESIYMTLLNIELCCGYLFKMKNLIHSGEELHPCPYEMEINDNYENVCNCCEECESECSADI